MIFLSVDILTTFLGGEGLIWGKIDDFRGGKGMGGKGREGEGRGGEGREVPDDRLKWDELPS